MDQSRQVCAGLKTFQARRESCLYRVIYTRARTNQTAQTLKCLRIYHQSHVNIRELVIQMMASNVYPQSQLTDVLSNV